jgi:1-pyrroline-5-carboxylate dehydrogenase
MPSTFRNEEPLDLRGEGAPEDLLAALARVRERAGETHGMRIGGTWVTAEQGFRSANPSDPDETIGRFAVATSDHVDRAVAVAWDAWPAWANVPVEERVACLRSAAALLREPERRLELDAALVLEIGKTWAEAEHETARTIDALEFYAEVALRRASNDADLPKRPGERARILRRPLGAGAVVPIWSFPCAQAATFCGAAIAAGNTVVLKPSSEAPGVTLDLVRILEQAGVPAGVLNVLTGPGPVVGAPLVAHPRVRFVCFKGSREVGLSVHEAAAVVHRDQGWVKRVLLQMGGKGTLIIDESADLDAAVEGVLTSAFSFQGQRSAAASRAVVHDAVYDRFLERLVPRVEALRVGAAEDPDTEIGPVVSEDAYDFIRRLVATAHADGRVLTGGDPVEGKGWLVRPVVVADVDPISRIGMEELFAPVLGVIRARDWDHALSVASNTDFGLTSGLYSTLPARVEDAWRRLEVGTLYVNRPCTGALIGAHPSGSLRLSGQGPRRGGAELVDFFLQESLLVERLQS